MKILKMTRSRHKKGTPGQRLITDPQSASGATGRTIESAKRKKERFPVAAADSVANARNEMRYLLDEVDSLRRQLDSAAGTWISTGDALPEIGKDVIACAKEQHGCGSYVFRGMYLGDKWINMEYEWIDMEYDAHGNNRVYCWMPIPTPPKKDSL